MTFNGCKGCIHPATTSLTAAVAIGDSYRDIAAAFGMSAMSAQRHATLHLSADLFVLRRLAETRGQAAMLSGMARSMHPQNPVRVAIIARLRKS